MRAVFGILSLVVVLAIVGSVAKRQLQSVNGGIVTRNASAASQAAALGGEPATVGRESVGGAGAIAADPNAVTVREQARSIEAKARDDTVRALQRGADRNASADR